MAPVSHQTIKLSRGKHRRPQDGACVMELASMLAGEPFGDHPDAVCPVIGSFLRAYNDSIDHRRRQDLYTYAAEVVGSRASGQVERRRAERLDRWTAERRSPRWTRLLLAARLPTPAVEPGPDAAGIRAVRAIARHTDHTHAQVLALIDELLAIGANDRAQSEPSRSSAPSARSAITAPSRAPASTSPG